MPGARYRVPGAGCRVRANRYRNTYCCRSVLRNPRGVLTVFTFSVRRRDLAWSLALIVLLSSIWVARSDQADAGVEPPAPGIAVVYVAVGTNFPDALGVGPGAGADSAPIIIVPTNPPIPAASSAELVRLDPKTVVIVGGLAVISQAMQDAIAALLPDAHVVRIAGADRYATNAMFSAATFPIEGWASIPAAAFTANEPDSDAVNLDSSFVANSSGGNIWAPIQLPHGAAIVELFAGVQDADAGGGICVYLYRVDNGGGVDEVASVCTTVLYAGGNTTVSDTSIAAGTEIVDNETYAYIIFVSGADGNPAMRTAKVRYQLGSSNG
jgi:ell wall binding domain 2 (CWB2)